MKKLYVSMKLNWTIISAIAGLIGGLITYVLTPNWKISLIVSIAIFILMILRNPKRRYMRAFYIALCYLITNIYFTIHLKTKDFDIWVGLKELDAFTVIFLGLICIVCLILDYLERSGKSTIHKKILQIKKDEKSFKQFLAPIIEPYQEQIELLKKAVEDKQKIQGLLDKEVIESYSEIAVLEKDKKSLENQVTHVLNKLKAKDLSKTTGLYQKASKCFVNGKLDRALKVLDEAKMEEEEQLAQESMKQKSETIMLKAQILRVKNKFHEAGLNYEKALKLFASWDNCLEVANYFKFLNEFEKASKYYNICINVAQTDSEKATTLNNLGVLQSDTNEFDKAERSYKEALEIIRKLAEVNPQTYLPDVAGTLNNLGVLQRAKNEFDQAEQSYKEALEKYRKLADVHPQTYLPDVAGTLNNLGVLQSDKNEFDQAEQSYKEALEIRRKLAEVNPQTYLPYVATTLNNLAALHYAKNEFDQAERYFKEALEIYRKLADVHPQTYVPKLSMTQINMSIFYQESKVNKELSIKLVDEAISNLLPFSEIPYIQNFLKVAFTVLKNWEMDVEEYLQEKRAANK